MGTNTKVANGWRFVRKTFNASDRRLVDNFSISDNISAELCVCLLSASSIQNFSGLKTKLQTSSAHWIEEFLFHGGIEVLFQSLERLTQRGKLAFVDAFKQLECVNCIKAVMNSRHGLDFMTQNNTFARNLVKG